ncbi:hypothetical protein ACQJBY_056036 [Aegilops geniculata]
MRAYSAAPPAAVSLPSAAAPPLTPDAAAVLSRAAGDASRRRHAHTTPLHAAAALLSGPAPLLRDACVAGLASPHPLRCRALDLCFAVALDRLPTSTEHHHGGHVDGAGFRGGPHPPPLSNALSAALKRAYAHHRRIGGSAVEPAGGDDHRVGVPHLVLAILDDPSVARVMREASFSSTAVKAAMLRSLSDPAAPDSGVYVSATRSLQHRQAPINRDEEVAKVVDVLKRGKKRNPVLVGDTADVDAVVQEVVAMIQRQRLGNARVIEFGNLADMDRSELVAKIRELGEAITSELLAPAMVSQTAGVVVNLGNLQWLVEERCAVAFGEPQETRREVVLDTARAAVAEMARVLEHSGGEGERRRVWVIGTATCATYLKCQVYHPALESEWDIQAVPITPRPPQPPSLGLSPSAGVNRGILSSSVEVLSSAMTGATTHRPAPGMCNACVDGYERERADMQCADAASSLNPTEKTMSRWLQIGTPASARPQPIVGFQDKARDADELWRRWLDRCAQLHSHGRPPAVTCSEWNGASVIGSMQAALPVRPSAPARGTVVDTDLALGTPVPSTTPASASASAWDTDEKVLAKRLTEAVRWQPEAAAAVADTIVKARLGSGKRRRVGPKADTWVLFAGADMVGKRRMAEALSVAIFGAGPVTVRLGCATTGDVDGGEESVVSCRGRTALDHVAETVRANPFRVVVLDDLDHADDVVHGAIVHAVESGRLTDSHGRDVALGSAIFIVMSSWSSSAPGQPADSPWNLELRVRRHTTPKRRPEQELDGHRRVKPRKPLPLDLNLSMCDDHIDDDGEDSGGEGSRNSSSDLTVEHEQEYAQPPSVATRSAQSNVHELIRAVDGTVVFRSVDFGPLKRSVSDVVSAKFGDAAGSGGWSVHVDAGVLDRLAGAAWTAAGASTATATSLESWANEVLCPSIRQLKRSLSSSDVDGATTVSLSAVEGIGRRRMDGDVLFPTSVTVAVDGN